MTAELILRAYAEIDGSTPLRMDCGALCGAACCLTDSDGQGGVALLPDEDTFLKDILWGKLEHDAQMNRPMLMCTDFCDRDLRPFLCRIFPLCPAIGKNGKWTVRMDARANAVCPLSRHGLNGLDPEFVRGTVRAVRIIASDPEGEDFLLKWSAIEAEFRNFTI